MNPEDEAELELLRRDVEALGGDPSSILARAQTSAAPRQAGPADFRDVGTYRYEYLDPGAPGAAPGTQQGPMADELKHLGVVKPGPQGHDMVDTAGLGFKNASATGELAREVESLRKEVDTLRGNPDAVLSRVNKPQARPRPRQGRAVAADVGLGDVTMEADGGFDRTTLEGAGAFNKDFMQREAEQRRIAEARAMYREAQANGFELPPLAGAAPRVRQPQDFDERQADELRAMAAYGTTDAERQANIKRELDAATMIGDDTGVARYRPTAAGSFAHELNVDPETGRTIGNVSEDEVRRALQRREELFL